MGARARAYDAILLDLDGTLVRENGTIHPRTLAALRDAHESGVRVMIATGRSEGGTLEVLDELGFDTPAVVFNGAGLYCPREARMIEERLLSDGVVRRAIDWTVEAGVLPVVIQAGAKYALRPRDEHEVQALQYFHDLQVVEADRIPTEYVIRVTAFSTTHETSEALARALQDAARSPVYLTDFPLNALPAHRTSPLLVADLHPPCRGKAEGIRFLAERYGITPDRVVAVGDASNDIPMFEAAGLSVAMKNSMPSALAAADRVIGDNNSDSLARLVEELFGLA